MDATVNPQVPVSQPAAPIRATTTTAPASQSTAAAASVVSPPATQTARKTRTFFRLSKLGDYVQEWGGIAFFAVLGVILWRADAHFTLWFAYGWAPSVVAQLSYGQWLIPVLLTLGQLYFVVGPKKIKVVQAARQAAAANPDHELPYKKYVKLRKKIKRHTAAFLIVSFINVGTSAQGMYEWAGGRTINLFGGFTLPQPGWTLRGISFALGILLAFGAEKALKAAWSEYQER